MHSAYKEGTVLTCRFPSSGLSHGESKDPKTCLSHNVSVATACSSQQPGKGSTIAVLYTYVYDCSTKGLGGGACECCDDVGPQQALKTGCDSTPDVTQAEQKRSEDENRTFPKVIGKWYPEKIEGAKNEDGPEK